MQDDSNENTSKLRKILRIKVQKQRAKIRLLPPVSKSD